MNMDNSFNDRPISEEEYYSEDFEAEEEIVEVIQEIQVAHADGENENEEMPSENAIIVHRSETRPRLTIETRTSQRKISTPIQGRTISESNIRLKSSKYSYLKKGSGLVVSRKRIPQSSSRKNSPRNALAAHAISEDSLCRVENETQDDKVSPKELQLVTLANPICGIKNYPHNYKITTRTICTSPLSGNRRVPGSTNITNRNYLRERRLVPHQLGATKASANIIQRVASAKKMAVNDFKNKVHVLIKEIEDLKKENRSLKIIQNRQTAALRKWEGRDAELPKLLQHHKEEIKTTQIQFKKTVAHCRELEEKVKVKDKKISKMEQDLQTLRALASKDNLRERSELQEQVELLSANVAGCEKKVRQYMRHIEIIESNHRHQLATEKSKLIRANNHALELRHEITELKMALRDKDRMLNYIQMRSTGRNLVKSYHNKEKNQNNSPRFNQSYSVNTMESHQHGSPRIRNRSISPRKNVAVLSGRSMRSNRSYSLERYEFENREEKVAAEQAEVLSLMSQRVQNKRTDIVITEERPKGPQRKEKESDDDEVASEISNHDDPEDVEEGIQKLFQSQSSSPRSIAVDDEDSPPVSDRPERRHWTQERFTAEEKPQPVVPDSIELTSTPEIREGNKNEYSRMSKMLEKAFEKMPAKKSKKGTNKVVEKSHLPLMVSKPQAQVQPEPQSLIVHSPREKKKKSIKPPNPKPSPMVNISSGPKSHAAAKREMKFIQLATECQLEEMSANNKQAKAVEICQNQRMKVNACNQTVFQEHDHTLENIPKKQIEIDNGTVNLEHGHDVGNSANLKPIREKVSKHKKKAVTTTTSKNEGKYAETTVKVRSPIGKKQVGIKGKNNRKFYQTPVNNPRKTESNDTVEVCVQIKKNSSRKEDKVLAPVSPDSSPAASSISANVSEFEEESEAEVIVPPQPQQIKRHSVGKQRQDKPSRQTVSTGAIMAKSVQQNQQQPPLDALCVPPPPQRFSMQSFPQTRKSSNMPQPLMSTQSYDNPQIQNNAKFLPMPPVSSVSVQEKHGSDSKHSNLSSREMNELKSHEAAMADFLRHNSHKLENGGMGDYVNQSYSTPEFPLNSRLQRVHPQFASSCAAIPLNKNAGYYNNVNSGSTYSPNAYASPTKYGQLYSPANQESSARSAFSHTQFPMQYQDQYTNNRGDHLQGASTTFSVSRLNMGQASGRSETKSIYSMMTPRTLQNMNQPMNLPFFSVAGDGPQQNQKIESPSHRIQSIQTQEPRNKNSQSYDPSFFSKLGTWK